jgi:signal transduction histidine kinase/ligand-binding sensor domain-containing protein
VVCVLLATRSFALDPQKAITQFTHRSWGSTYGIGMVGSITQTTDGYLWISSVSGIFKFDGIDFTRLDLDKAGFGSMDPDPSDSRTALPPILLGARDGSLWITSLQSVMRLKNGSWKKYGPQDGLPGGNLYAICEGNDGSVWAGGRKGLSRFQDGKWRRYDAESQIPSGALTAVMVDRENVLWVAIERDPRFPSSSAVAFLRLGERLFQTACEGELIISGMSEAPDGKIWVAQVGRAARAFVRDSAKIRFVHPEIRVGTQDLHVDRDGSLWVDSWGDGMRRARNTTVLDTNDIAQMSDEVDKFTQKDSLSSDMVYCTFEDREGNIWVGTLAGLDCFSENKVASFSRREGLPFDQGLMLQASADGSVWAGSTPQGFARLKKGDAQFKDLGWSFFNPKAAHMVVVSSMYADPAGPLFLGTGCGVVVVENGATNGSLLAGGPNLLNVLSITRDRSGALWLCDIQSGIFRFRDNIYEKVPYRQHRTADIVTAAQADIAGRMWLGSVGGFVTCYDKNQPPHWYSSQDGLFSGPVRSIMSDSNGQMWFVGKGGISKFDHGHFLTLNRDNGLPEDDLSALLQDDMGFFWLVGSTTLFRVSPASLNDALSSPSRKVSGELIDANDGLRGFVHGQLGWGMAWPTKGADGRLWFPTTAGVAVVDPRHIPRNPLPPPVHIQQIVAAGKAFRTPGHLDFPIGTRNCEMDYVGLSFVNPAKVRYRYKLEGYDQDWVDAGPIHQAHYSSLKPKKYKFQVIACNNDGVWNKNGDSVEFSILPAFYETAWFPPLCALPVALAAWGLYRLRIARITARMKQQLEGQIKERKRIAQELHDTLLQGFTGLGLKLDALANSLPPAMEGVKKQIQKLLDQSDQYLTEARRSVWELRSATLESHEDFSKALVGAGERALAGTGVELSFSVAGTARKLDKTVENNLLRICEEAAANAVKHGHPTHIEVVLEFKPEELGLLIRDNGSGFDSKNLKQAKDGHFGLVGMKERAESMSGKFILNSQPGKGTELVVTARA